jgi:hypothetical protein
MSYLDMFSDVFRCASELGGRGCWLRISFEVGWVA